MSDGDPNRIEPPWRDVSYPRAVLAVLVVATVVALLVAATTSSAAFGLYNPTWEGTSELRDVADGAGTEPEVVQNVSRYGTAGEGAVAVVLAPDRTYTDAEAAQVRAFVERGGTLVVAEDVGGTGNRLLADIGASARVNGTLLRDERYSYRSPAMPLARNVTANQSLTAGVGRLTLNYGSVVEPGTETDETTVLVRSSEYAYLDRNGNAELDENETLASRPVVTAESIGEGRVVVVSDPSVFINAMLERSGNRRFATNLVAGADRLLLDYSHAADLPPLTAALLTVRNVPLFQAGIAGLGFGMIAVWGLGGFGPLYRRLAGRGGESRAADAPADRESLVAYLSREHPEWDRERIERVTQSTSTDREEP